MHKLKSNHIKLTKEKRIYNASHPIIALTGGIATGKTTSLDFFKKTGLKVIDADRLIKEIYASANSLEYIGKLVPGAVMDNTILFPKLREVFFGDAAIKEQIESFLYQQLPKAFAQKLASFNLSEGEFVIYDIPLLFEKELQDKFDLNILIYSSRETQLKRVVKRDRISEELANSILDQQMDIELKKKKSQFVIHNDKNVLELNQELGKLLLSICL